MASRYFGYQATLHCSVYRALFGCSEAGTVRNMALRCQTSIYSRALSRAPFLGARTLFCPELLMEPFGYTPAAMPVGPSWVMVLDRPMHRHWRRSSMSPVISQARVGSRAYLVARRQSHHLNFPPRSGLAQAQPAGIYGVSSNRTWAQCIFHSSLHHQDPDLGRPATQIWSTSHRLVVYFPDARLLTRPRFSIYVPSSYGKFAGSTKA